MDLHHGRMVGCEALARWKSPGGAVSSIETVIDELEADEDLATALSARMLECISKDLGQFLLEQPRFSVSVNMPPIVIGRGRIMKVAEELGLMPHLNQIVGEIPERQALSEHGKTAVRRARELGARIAIDDFGTGESGQLMDLEVDTLKIDKSFVVLLGKDYAAERRGIVALATVLKVDLVAEGVETPEQASFLRAIGVEKGRGWLWSKAVAPAELDSLMGGVRISR